MKKKILNTLKYLIFLSIGILLFYWLYKKNEGLDIEQLKEANYWWVLASFLIGLLSHISRAIRWNMLIKPLGYHPRTINSFFAVMIMYLANVFVPRAGEVARCTVLSKYEKVPFTKLIGTVVVERITDVVALLFFATLIIISQIGVFAEFLMSNPESKAKLIAVFSTKNILVLGLLTITFFVSIYVFRKALKNTKIYSKMAEVLKSFTEGLKTILQLENKWAYIGHTVFIYLIWLIALYVIFFAYEPTSKLSLMVAMAAFVMGAFGMVAPVQAGIGPYHFMVMSTLFIYGIPEKDGFTFAFIAHAAANIPLMLAGVISFILLPVVNKNYKPEEVSDNGH